MRHARTYTVLLFGIMALSICKHQLPYIQYNLLEDYIAENLCVNRGNENSCCHGKCFLEKQIGLLSETDSAASPATGNRVVFVIDDYVIDNVLPPAPRFSSGIYPALFTAIYIIIKLDIPTPPPEHEPPVDRLNRRSRTMFV
jgi:hypothetical protein